MTSTTTATARDRSPLFAALLDLWSARRASDKRPPSREALEPVDLMRFLPHLAMAEVDGTAVRIVWAGTGVRERIGGDPVGRPLADLVPGVGAAAALSRAIGGEPAALARTSDRPAAAAHVGMPDAALLLPLSGDDGGTVAILAAFVW